MSPIHDLKETICSIPFDVLLRLRLEDVVASFDADHNNDLYHEILDQVDRVLVQLALERTCFNQVHAARILGINRNTLRRKIKSHDITLPAPSATRRKQ